MGDPCERTPAERSVLRWAILADFPTDSVAARKLLLFRRVSDPPACVNWSRSEETDPFHPICGRCPGRPCIGRPVRVRPTPPVGTKVGTGGRGCQWRKDLTRKLRGATPLGATSLLTGGARRSSAGLSEPGGAGPAAVVDRRHSATRTETLRKPNPGANARCLLKAPLRHEDHPLNVESERPCHHRVDSAEAVTAASGVPDTPPCLREVTGACWGTAGHPAAGSSRGLPRAIPIPERWKTVTRAIDSTGAGS
jgi:hypothetical protein